MPRSVRKRIINCCIFLESGGVHLSSVFDNILNTLGVFTFSQEKVGAFVLPFPTDRG